MILQALKIEGKSNEDIFGKGLVYYYSDITGHYYSDIKGHIQSVPNTF